MKRKLQLVLASCSSTIEIVIGVFVLVACGIGGVGVIFNTNVASLFSSPEYFIEWINIICYFVIGVEFVKMITSHSVDSVVDVLLVALARQMVVEHVQPFDALLIIIAVTLLFFVRKYLYIPKIDSFTEKANQKNNIR